MINAGDFLNIHQITAVGKEAGLVFGERLFGEAIVRHLKAVEIGRVKLLKGANDALHT